MALHFLYIIAFTILAVLAIANLIRNMISLGTDTQRSARHQRSPFASQYAPPPHPEFLDNQGRVIHEPLLVMRSMTVDDAREQLDAIYESSPGPVNPNRDALEEQ